MCVILVGVVAGCSNDPIAIRDLPNDFVNATCNRDVACQNTPDSTTCHTTAGTANDSESLTIFADVDAGVIKYDAAAAQACLDLSKATCSFAGLHTAPEPNPCDQILTGTVGTGGACVIDQECAGHASCTQTDSACDRSTTCCPGTCGMTQPATTVVALGGMCDDQALRCATTAYCKMGSGSGQGTCTALITGAGTACDSFYACANPLYCNIDISGGGAPATCKAPAASNATCVTTEFIACGDSRDYCDPTMLKCVRRAAVGAACPNGVECVGYASCQSAVCVAQPKLGETCVVDGPLSCLGNASCVTGTCQLPPAGMSCH